MRVEQAGAVWVRRRKAPRTWLPSWWVGRAPRVVRSHRGREGLDALLQVARGDRDLASDLVEDIGATERLRAYLHRFGWEGELGADRDGSQPEWWLGVPRLVGSGGPVLPMTVEIDGGRCVTGVVSGLVSGYDVALPQELAFRLDVDQGAIRGAGSLLALLVPGAVRFSWLLPPRETAASAGSGSGTQLTERVCLHALREVKGLIADV